MARRAKRAEVKATIIRQANGPGSSTLWELKRDGVLLGFVEQYAPTPRETRPVKAFRPQFRPGQRPCPGEMVGSFYGTNAWQPAIEALDKA
jgi:hypothetical protein